ncbi:hypothetical protein KTJ59_05655, partial [Acinetobacter baumannii]|nr:hypothetical protein [Acinetobacter baumannii]
NRRITATPLEIRPKLKNRHGVQRTLTVKLIHNFHKNASDSFQQPIIFYNSQAFKACIQCYA